MAKKIVIIDGNSLINRAYYAMQRPMMTKEGVYTHAVYGFINMLNKIIKDQTPDYMAVAWDLKSPTFRHKEYKEYKAGRKKMPMELAMQLPIMEEVLDAMKIKNLSLEGYEADDIIGTIARRGEADGLDVLVITGDKDALQLVSEKTKVMITRKGISEFDLYDEAKMLERYELTPTQFIDLKGLMGDQSDNIPGIPGVGEKTGINLLKQFGSITNMLDNVDEISQTKLREKVRDNAPLALMSRRLAEIQTNVPIDTEIESLKMEEPDTIRLVDVYSKLEFQSFIKKLDGGIGASEEDKSQSLSTETIELKNLGIIEDASVLADVLKPGELFIKVFSDNSHINMPTIYGIAFVIDGKYYYAADEGVVRKLIDEINDKKPIISGHGLSQDEYCLIINGAEGFTTGFDTEVCAYILDPSKSGYSLKALAAEHLHKDVPEEKEFYKGLKQESFFDDNRDAYSDYGFQWLSAVVNLKNVQKNKLEAEGLEIVYEDIERPLVYTMAAMEKEGFRTDKETLLDFGKELVGEIDSITSEIYKIADTEFNINSPKQLGEVLFEKLKLPAGKKTKTGYSTSAEVLEKLYDEHPIIPDILRYRTLAKLNSTYVEGLVPLIGFDGKIRPHFQQTVTATGRISCTEPNLQNIPIRNEYGRLLRKAFAAENSDCLLVGADYSQIELRVLAHLSEDESLIGAFNNGEDIHRATASRVFEVPYDEVTSLDRSKAKAVNFGVIYGMSGFGLSEELGISRKDAENFIKDYFEKHPKVKAYMDAQKTLCKERGYTETLFGRRRYIPEIKSSNFMVRSLGERLAMNSPIQGTAADIIKKAMNLVSAELINGGYKSRLILQVHDELIINTYKDEQERVEELLVRNMKNAAELKVDLVADLNSGSNWYELK